MSLHDELHRIAERAPVADVPPETWRRGRRAAVRTRLLGGAAALAVLAALLGVVAWPHPDPPVAAGAAPGLPDHLYAVPEGVDAEDDVAVGRSAAAWIDPLSTNAVLVGAVDGAYHVVRLPGLRDVPISDHPPLALSPDGRRLAWAFATSADHETGIRVADLATGEITSVPLRKGAGVSVLQLVFSPGGRWLGWSGAQLTYWNGSGARADSMAVGRLDLDTGRSQTLRSGGWPDPAAIGVDDRGRVRVLDSQWLTTLTGHDVSRVRANAGRISGPLVTDAATGRLAAGVGGTGPTDDPARGTGVVVVTPQAQVADRPSTSLDAYTSALAWVGRDVLVAVAPLDGSTVAPEGMDLELIGPGHDPRVVGHTDPLVSSQLSVAADLLSAGAPTVERPAPHWPWSDGRKAAYAGWAVAALTGVGAGAWLVRRRYRSRR